VAVQLIACRLPDHTDRGFSWSLVAAQLYQGISLACWIRQAIQRFRRCHRSPCKLRPICTTAAAIPICPVGPIWSLFVGSAFQSDQCKVGLCIDLVDEMISPHLVQVDRVSLCEVLVLAQEVFRYLVEGNFDAQTLKLFDASPQSAVECPSLINVVLQLGADIWSKEEGSF
jgi:hypothetical protein